MSLQLLKRQIDRSHVIIERMLEVSHDPYLALSFGKDSIVMLDLVRDVFPDITCKFLTSDETMLMHNFDELIDFYKGINLEIVKTTTLSDNNYKIDDARYERKADWYLDTFLRHDGVFMGLRIEESKARRISIILKENNEVGERIMQYKTGKRTGQYRCCPVADWSAFEIMLYAKERNLKLLDAYQFGEQVRTTARITRAEKRSDMLQQIKLTDPSRYNLLLATIPELQFYKV